MIFISDFLKCKKLCSKNDLNLFTVATQAFIHLAFDNQTNIDYILINNQKNNKFLLKLKVDFYFFSKMSWVNQKISMRISISRALILKTKNRAFEELPCFYLLCLFYYVLDIT